MALPARTTISIGALLLALLAVPGSFAAEDHAASELKGTWSGTFNQYSHDINDSFAVKLTVDAISGSEFTGTMEWPTFDTTTRVMGMVEGSLIKWTETGYIKGDDAVLNGLYVAHFTATNEITGDWMDPKHTITPKGPRFGTRGADFVLKKD
ncbi:hypothetical protein [Bradyrhizobium sp. BR13661]|jgi:hypothetical protein|uniref:hypothetical protein n=1 Tax=Bradyrhizobium sp. BR13661 TaxID=2940622 RepID=UPI002475BD37|nr:hypothetical protein [Bradyrhizobium sp. BR13661]MDH6257991.1 hypothetical protein [Bradyrhizobium sp. BR13661]